MTEEATIKKIHEIDGNGVNHFNATMAFTIGMLQQFEDKFHSNSKRGRLCAEIWKSMQALLNASAGYMTPDEIAKAKDISTKMYEELFSYYYVEPRKRTCKTCQLSVPASATLPVDTSECKKCSSGQGEEYHHNWTPIRRIA